MTTSFSKKTAFAVIAALIVALVLIVLCAPNVRASAEGEPTMLFDQQVATTGVQSDAIAQGATVAITYKLISNGAVQSGDANGMVTGAFVPAFDARAFKLTKVSVSSPWTLAEGYGYEDGEDWVECSLDEYLLHIADQTSVDLTLLINYPAVRDTVGVTSDSFLTLTYTAREDVFGGAAGVSYNFGFKAGQNAFGYTHASHAPDQHMQLLYLDGEEQKAIGADMYTLALDASAIILDVAPANVELPYNGQSRIASVTPSAHTEDNTDVFFTYSTEAQGTFTSEVPGFKDAGTYTVYYKATAENHGELNGSFTVTITPVALTLTADNKAITYGDDAPEYTVTSVGFVNGETFSALTGNLSCTCAYQAGDSAGGYAITIGGVSSTNYDITFVPGTLTVGNATLTNVSVAQSGALTYNGENQTASVSASATAVNDQTVTFTYSTQENGVYSATVPAFKNAGNHTVYYKANAASHNEATGSFTVSIGKKALTVTAENKSVKYGDAVPAYSVSYDGFVNGETISALTGALAFACDYTTTTVPGTYPITPSGFTSDNYEITFVPGTLTVGNATLTNVSVAQSGTLTYNGENQTASVSASATAVNDQTVTFTYSTSENGPFGSEVPAFEDAGEHTVYYKVSAPYHNEISGSITITINKRALTVTADDKVITYGDAAPVYTLTYSGFADGENQNTAGIFSGEITCYCSYAVGSDADNYTIVPNNQITSANYEIEFFNGTLTVGKKKLTLTCEYQNGTVTLGYSGKVGEDNFSVTYQAGREENNEFVFTALEGADYVANADDYGKTVKVRAVPSGNDNYDVSDDVTLDAFYRVTFANGGVDAVMPSAQYVFANCKLAAFVDPSKEGYAFRGWLLNSEAFDPATQAITEEIILVADWEKTIYQYAFRAIYSSALGGDLFTTEGALFYYLDWDEQNARFVVATTASNDQTVAAASAGTYAFTVGDEISRNVAVQGFCVNRWFRVTYVGGVWSYQAVTVFDPESSLDLVAGEDAAFLLAEMVQIAGAGDINGDGKVTTMDLIAMHKYVVGSSYYLTSTGKVLITSEEDLWKKAFVEVPEAGYFFLNLWDVNADASPDARDITIVNQALATGYGWKIVTDATAGERYCPGAQVVSDDAFVTSGSLVAYQSAATFDELGMLLYYGRRVILTEDMGDPDLEVEEVYDSLTLDLGGKTLTAQSIIITATGKITITNGKLAVGTLVLNAGGGVTCTGVTNAQGTVIYTTWLSEMFAGAESGKTVILAGDVNYTEVVKDYSQEATPVNLVWDLGGNTFTGTDLSITAQTIVIRNGTLNVDNVELHAEGGVTCTNLVDVNGDALYALGDTDVYVTKA